MQCALLKLKIKPIKRMKCGPLAFPNPPASRAPDMPLHLTHLFQVHDGSCQRECTRFWYLKAARMRFEQSKASATRSTRTA